MTYKKIKSSQLGEVDYMLYKFILDSIFKANKEIKVTMESMFKVKIMIRL